MLEKSKKKHKSFEKLRKNFWQKSEGKIRQMFQWFEGPELSWRNARIKCQLQLQVALRAPWLLHGYLPAAGIHCSGYYSQAAGARRPEVAACA